MKNLVLKYKKGLYMKNYEMTKRVAYTLIIGVMNSTMNDETLRRDGQKR
jgi:hypothetical protein